MVSERKAELSYIGQERDKDEIRESNRKSPKWEIFPLYISFAVDLGGTPIEKWVIITDLQLSSK